MLTFTDGTSELQQCFDLMVVDDNLVEQDEFFSLTATASSGSTTQFFIISNDDSEYYVFLKFTEILLKLLNFRIITDALIGLDQESYTVNEADGSVTVCVVLLMNSGIQDSILTAAATLSAAGGNATGIETVF